MYGATIAKSASVQLAGQLKATCSKMGTVRVEGKLEFTSYNKFIIA